MGITEDDFAELAYSAGAQPSRWSQVLGEIASKLNVSALQIVMTQPGHSEVSFASEPKPPDDSLTREVLIQAGRLPIKLIIAYPRSREIEIEVPAWQVRHLRIAAKLTQRQAMADAAWNVLAYLATRQGIALPHETSAPRTETLGSGPPTRARQLGTESYVRALGGRSSETAQALSAACPLQTISHSEPEDDTEVASAAAIRVLSDLFELTLSEAKLAERCGSGLDLSEVAVTLGITRATAKYVLQRVFQKLNIRRQADLVLLVSKLRGALTT